MGKARGREEAASDGFVLFCRRRSMAERHGNATARRILDKMLADFVTAALVVRRSSRRGSVTRARERGRPRAERMG